MYDHVPSCIPVYGSAKSVEMQLLTVATAIQQVDQWSDLTPTRRRDLVSALNTVARIAGLPASNTQLTPAALRPRILTVSAAQCGVTPGHIRNVRSLLADALRRLNVIDTEDTPIAAEWSLCLNRLSHEQRRGLIRFARFCTARALTPSAVSSEILQAFLEHITERTLVRDPRKLVGRIRIVWNQACACCENWPGRPLAPLKRQRPTIRPITAFVRSFQIDVAAFGGRLTATILDLLDDDLAEAESDDGATALICPKPMRASTAALRMNHVRWAANALVDSGVPIHAVATLRDLVTPLDQPKAILRHLYRRAGDKPSARGMHVAQALLMIAKYHVRLSKTDIARIRAWGKSLRLLYTGMTEKNQVCMRQALDPAREQKLGVLPEALMRIARKICIKNPRLACARAMTGAAIKLFSRRMLRLENVCGLRIDRHLQRADPRHSLVTHVFIPADESKTHRDISLPIAPDIGRLLEEWITDFRPIIAAPDCPYLFPGYRDGNRRVTPQGLRLAIKKITKACAGVELSPHQFRHLAAHTFLDEYPGHYEEVRQQLGHTSLVVTVRHYSGTQTEAAMRRFDEVILKRRQRRGKSIAKMPTRQSSPSK